jgi:hypothetical protein
MLGSATEAYDAVQESWIRFGWTDVCPATGLQGEVFETLDGHHINRNTVYWGPEEVASRFVVRA